MLDLITVHPKPNLGDLTSNSIFNLDRSLTAERRVLTLLLGKLAVLGHDSLGNEP